MTTLIVEDGSIVPGANSYIDLDDAATYWTNWGYASQVGSDTTVQTNALYASAYAMDRLYGRFYLGKIAKHSPQSMLFPRQRSANDEAFIHIQDTTGAGAVLVARVIDGAIIDVYIVEGGSNYTAPLLLVFGGTGASLTANLTSGAITSVTINTAGNNYRTAKSIIDNNGSNIAINQIPQSLLDAQCELAVMAIVSGSATLFPNENEDRYIQQEIDQLGAGLNFRRQFFPKEATDIERYQGFRKVELLLWNIMNREMVVTL